MKVKTMLFGFLVAVCACAVCFEGSTAKSKTKEEEQTASKIGVVSVRKVFLDCKKNAKYREQAKAEQDKAIEELQQLRAEIKAAEAALDTIKPGTKDYYDRAQELAQKKALLPLKQDYYETQFAEKDKLWTEQLYKDTLRFVSDIAKEKALELVFESDEPEFPISRPDELMLTIRTHSLLYKGNSIDITSEVITRVDANN
jgi:Skp family chaperone for outer membrane proteins